MSSDISRTGDDGHQHYKGVVMQQGRVILDRDFNALQEIVERRTDADALDFVGPCGTPDNGFAINAPIDPGSPPLWIPPPPLSPPAANTRDFLISPGTMYVGGQRAVFPQAGFGKPAIAYSYFDQPDWIKPDLPKSDALQEFIYLQVLEQEVSAVEDPDLKDVALGGPDTTQRVRLVKRVKRLMVTSADCITAQAQAQGVWLQQGLAFNPQTMGLLPQATLKVSFSAAASQPDPCHPVAQGGYLDAENQLIRVQITDGGVAGGTPKLLWGYDNASFLYRASISNSTTLLLGQSPVDTFHIPQEGQVVEVLRSALIIDSEPDETDPLKRRSIVRCVAEANGVICTLTASYKPDDRSITLDQALPQEYLDDTNPLFVRIWQSQLDLNATGSSTVELTNTSTKGTTGILVTIDVPSSGGQLQNPPIGAYWMFAVRPSTPQAVYPERFLTDAQPPDGPRQWVCPLAVIDWAGQSATSPPDSPIVFGPAIHDCRETFDNLVELTKRKLGGCCVITMQPGDLETDPAALQKILDKFAKRAQGIAICLTPGTYSLAESLRLDSRHNGVTIEACHGAVTIRAQANADLSKFLDGLVVLTQSTGVTLRGIGFIAPAVPLSKALQTSGANANNLKALIGGLFDPHMMIGLRLLDCIDVTVMNCEFQIIPVSGVGNFAAAIFANGNCTGLSVRQSRFSGPARVPPTITSFVVLAEAPAPVAAPSPAAAPVVAERPANILGSRAAPSILRNALAANAVLRALRPDVIAPATNAVEIPPLALEAPPLPVMLTAFLITPSVEFPINPLAAGPSNPHLLARAVLDQTEFVNNRVQGLTVAVVGVTGAGNVRFQDNVISDCVGGIWLGGIVADDASPESCNVPHNEYGRSPEAERMSVQHLNAAMVIRCRSPQVNAEQ